MALRRFLPTTNKIRSLFFLLLVTEDTEEEIDLRISSVKVSERLPFKVKNYKEI